ncbi:hypothetical protein KA005_13895 [bacterium]|nr:hypothetical protein [bacterium]
MAKDKDNKYDAAAFHVVKMLEGIPKDLVDLFTPDDEDGLVQLEINIVKWLARAQERAKVMQLQKHHGLSLRPNQSLRDVTIRLKILELKKKLKSGGNSGDYPPFDTGYSDV